MNKAIIFDYTGVLTKEGNIYHAGELLAEKYNCGRDDFLRLMKENWKKARINDMSSKLFWKNLADYLKIDSDLFRKDYLEFFKIDVKVLEFIKKLKTNYKLGLLSNQLEDWLEEEIKKYNLDNVFDVIVASYQIKKAKPELEVYKGIAKKLKVYPSECIFVDDLERNLIPARELGMNTILFKDLKQLKEELKRLSIKL